MGHRERHEEKFKKGRPFKTLKKLLTALIRFYQKHISPATPPSCRFYPTCSAYAIEAISTHGALKGSLLAIWRILRCNPFSKGGYDPVPPPKHHRANSKRRNCE
ncbi:membrane protein insertion efficiency factor YidD [Neobittarella massiliensis]|uniref:Putative membrane protein insertion efficiency factor n=1 Tax=Neobittarella massiliensis (ex Bilen et al. 2018) TaxID=2041842 RepID=A0A8J6IPL9_9FIRM|nr:membrane protein insertion efficiency factor YidD [Neobittarella massiliensis]